MIVAGLVVCMVAALVHVYIFYIETIAWTSERTMRTFGIASQEEAQATAALAFNLGFYNLFLAISILVGAALVTWGNETVGYTLVVVGALSMVAAAMVLLISSPDKRAAAMKQMGAPLLGLLLLGIAAVI